MSLKSLVQPHVAALLTSTARRDAARWLHEGRRRLQRRPHRVTAYVRLDDPYALVLLHALELVRERFEVELDLRAVGPTPDAMDPAPESLRAWARLDASRLAALYELDVPSFGDRRASPAELAALVPLERAADPLREIRAAIDGWWRGQPLPAGGSAERLRSNDRQRDRRGHYLSAMVYYEGEWYWGVDRLDHLEARLERLGLRRVAAPPAFERRYAFLDQPPPARPASGSLELFWSGRSPYAYLALDRAFRLADHYGLPVQIRPVLPMVMRGLSVPTRKRMYILLDAKREADRLGVPLGRICDPVGRGIERGYALVEVARQHDRLREFVLAFSASVWSRGVDAATDAGLRAIAEAAGLPWATCRSALGGDRWRQEVEDNRAGLVDAGYWGVPILRVGETTVWGQDRFWVLERALQASSRG